MIQESLNRIGTAFPGVPPLAVDGIFGARTQASVIAFQRQFALVPDGIVGPITWEALRRQSALITPSSPPGGAFNYTIVLDAGHGGSDPGAVFGARLEKNDNLRLALAVQRLLQARGQNVIMTRSTDVFVPLGERSAISNRNNADIFVSIHRNSSTNHAANGVENYVFTTASDTEVLYAQTVLRQIVDAGVQNNDGVIRANFAVLRNTQAPAMLLEMGFITNQRDNQLFDQNFDTYARAIADGIMTSLRGPISLPPSYRFYTVAQGDNLWSIAARFGTTVNAILASNGLTTDRVVLGQVLQIPISQSG